MVPVVVRTGVNSRMPSAWCEESLLAKLLVEARVGTVVPSRNENDTRSIATLTPIYELNCLTERAGCPPAWWALMT